MPKPHDDNAEDGLQGSQTSGIDLLFRIAGLVDEGTPGERLPALRDAYLAAAAELGRNATAGGGRGHAELPDFELSLFTNHGYAFDLLMRCCANATRESEAEAQAIKDDLIAEVRADARYMAECDDLVAFIASLRPSHPLDAGQVEAAYLDFRNALRTVEVMAVADRHGLSPSAVIDFAKITVERRAVDHERISDLFGDFGMGWRERIGHEWALAADLAPILRRQADEGEPIRGLDALARLAVRPESDAESDTESPSP